MQYYHIKMCQQSEDFNRRDRPKESDRKWKKISKKP